MPVVPILVPSDGSAGPDAVNDTTPPGAVLPTVVPVYCTVSNRVVLISRKNGEKGHGMRTIAGTIHPSENWMVAPPGIVTDELFTYPSSSEIVTLGAVAFTSTSPLVNCGVAGSPSSTSDEAPTACAPLQVTVPMSTPPRVHASTVLSASAAGSTAASGTVAPPIALVVTFALPVDVVPATVSASPRRMIALAGAPSTTIDVAPADAAPFAAISIVTGSVRDSTSNPPADGFTTSHDASALRSAGSVTRFARMDGTATVTCCTTRPRNAIPDGDGTSAENAPSAVRQSEASPPTTTPSTLATCTALSLTRLSVISTASPSFGRSHQPFTWSSSPMTARPLAGSRSRTQYGPVPVIAVTCHHVSPSASPAVLRGSATVALDTRSSVRSIVSTDTPGASSTVVPDSRAGSRRSSWYAVSPMRVNAKRNPVACSIASSSCPRVHCAIVPSAIVASYSMRPGTNHCRLSAA